jgi:hypothetical protein
MDGETMSMNGYIRPHLPKIPGKREDQLRELRRLGRHDPKKSMCIAEYFGNIHGEPLCILKDHGFYTPDKVYGSEFIAMVTHRSHSFVGVNYLKDRIILLGYVLIHGVPDYLICEIPHEQYVSGLAWYPFKLLNKKEHPEYKRYISDFMSLNVVPKDDVIFDPKDKREIMDTARRNGNGVIYMTAQNNPTIQKEGAAGNVYLKNYSEKGDKIHFMFAFYGTVEGKYVGFDENPRGSLEPNYKMLATGYGLRKGEDRHLFFSFRIGNQIYVFRYCLKGNVKPTIDRAYFISTNDDKTDQLLQEVPNELIVSKAGASADDATEVNGKPLFYVDYRGRKVESSPDNTLEEEMRPEIKSKKKLAAISMEDAENFFNPRSHIKERPEVVSPEAGLVQKKRVFAAAVKHIAALGFENVEVLQEDNILRVNIIQEDGSFVFRMKTSRTEISLAYMDENERWISIKKYTAETQGKAVGRLVKLVKQNAIEEEE